MSTCKVRDRLDWLLQVYPGCAILIVRDAHRLPEGRCHAVKSWGHDNLWPGNYDVTGLQDPPPGACAWLHGSGSAGSSRAWLEQGVAEKGQKGEGAKGNEGKSKKGKNGKKGGGKKGKGNQ